MQRIILHIDFDSFFASVEQQDTPFLRGKPIGVTATNGRTCIIAASREAKRVGVTSPSRTSDAKKICPMIQFVPSHFVRYWEVSKKFLALCERFSPTVELFSLDEVFMDVTLTAPLFGGVDSLIEKFKRELAQEVGEYITASVGISHNKLLAKLASGLKKPNGVMEITRSNLWKVYESAQLTDICGIGRRIEKRLEQMGIATPLQLRFTPRSSLIAEFGEETGKFLADVGMGIDHRAVLSYREKDDVKSVGRQYCLPQNEYDQRKVLQNMYELCEEVALKLRRLQKKARTVGFYLGGSDSMHGRQTFETAIDTGKDIFEACQNVLNKESGIKNYEDKKFLIHNSLFILPTFVRRIGISVSNLVDAKTVPVPLFPHDRKREKVQGVIDRMNERFGHHTIRNGFLLYADKLTTVPNGFGSDRYERSKL